MQTLTDSGALNRTFHGVGRDVDRVRVALPMSVASASICTPQA